MVFDFIFLLLRDNEYTLFVEAHFFSELTFHVYRRFKTFGKFLQLPYANEAKNPNSIWSKTTFRKLPPRIDITGGWTVHIYNVDL